MVLSESFVDIATDPAHIFAELVFTLVFDFVIIAFLWGVVFKKLLLPFLTKKIHEEIDIEHGYVHDAPAPYTNYRPAELRYIKYADIPAKIGEVS